MRVVSNKKLVDYYTKHAACKTALEEWHQRVVKANWQKLNELKRDFLSADYVGNNRIVFNIKGNDYRLVAIVIYVSQKVYVRWLGSHDAYNRVDVKNI